ncbi:hypothetical protein BD410DRAFT_777771 [Rickenella mellea]|uniref:Novel STAND NTPase 1 domain-containing protein n=1 Tax=Rickenella mellea TaxID=50990 RepID=A0A4Y7PKM3_9AGAM|nr:hypothetical protein BD410DRAFT_777771 [Rickenella mellea]
MPSPPSTSEYVFEGTKISLKLLSDVACLIPIPYVQAALEAANKLILTGAELHSQPELRDQLNTRVCALMLVMIAPLKGKMAHQIPPDLKGDIEQLTDLECITSVLRKIANQNQLLLIIFRSINTEKITSRANKLDTSMKKFDVSRHINDAVRLSEISNNIRDGIGLATKISDKIDILCQRIHVASTLPLMVMPTKPRIFFGRDDVVEDLARRMFMTNGPLIAILGPGGMGKTSVALAVMQHELVKARFGKNLFWVPCSQSTSSSRLLDLIAAGLRITQNTLDRLDDILTELNATTDPRAVLLDNFETPWNLPDHRPDVENILCALANVAHLSILVTMRSSDPPSEEIDWYSENLSSLLDRDARRVYIANHPEAGSDAALDALLAELSYMPLTITLMSKLGRNSSFMPTTLLNTWRIKHTDMLHRRPDPKNSVSFSIQLSLNSPLVKADPDAVTLLFILSMLPGGAQSNFLHQLAPSISNIPGAIVTLTQSSLAERRVAARSVHVIPLIRSYMLDHHPLPDAIRKDVHEAYYQLISSRKSEPGEPKFTEYTQAISIEETNIRAVLMDATRNGSDDASLDALLSLSWYQCWTRPRTEIVDHTVQLARAAENKLWLAEALRCKGHIYFLLDRYHDACLALEIARNNFIDLNNPLHAARCLLKLSNIYTFIQTRDAVERVQEEFHNLSDSRGIADGLLQLGEYYDYMNRYTDAHATLENAQKRYVELNYPLGVAHCNIWLARYAHENNYDSARSSAEQALVEYKHLSVKEQVVVCVIELCSILKSMSQYEEAHTRIAQGLELSQEVGSPLCTAQLLRVLGDVYLQQKDGDRACSAYQQAWEYYQRIASHVGESGVTHCKVMEDICSGRSSEPHGEVTEWSVTTKPHPALDDAHGSAYK